MNVLNNTARAQRKASSMDKVDLRVGHYPPRLRKIRRDLICLVAIMAYLATALGAQNNIVYLCLAVSALVLAWPVISGHLGLRWAFFALLLSVLWGAQVNGVVASLRSATPYIALLVAFALLAQEPAANDRRRTNGIALLYGGGLLQLATYVTQSSASHYYSFFYSLDEFNRLSIGWVSVICFFHASLPAQKKRELPRRLRYIGYLFWLVPLLVMLNSSRSELLMTAMLLSISLYMRWRLLFVGLLAVMVMTLPLIAVNITGVARTSGSIEEVFTTDIYTLSDAHTNYRAFENLMMVDRIAASVPFGCGLGCAVPFPITMVLNEIDYDEVTVFHNGLLTVLLHFGLAGAALILLLVRQLMRAWRAFSRAYRRCNSTGSANVQGEAVRLAVLLLLLGTSVTTGGFMSSLDSLVLLLPLCSVVGAMGVRLDVAPAHAMPNKSLGANAT